jgi:hypothetical protein
MRLEGGNLSTKYFSRNEDNIMVQYRTADAVRYEVTRDKRDGSINRSIRAKEMWLSLYRPSESAPFYLTWMSCNSSGKPLENPTQWNTHEQGAYFNIDMGKFATLKEAENFALGFAYDYREYGNFFPYDPVFDKLKEEEKYSDRINISEIPVLWKYNRATQMYDGIKIQIPYNDVSQEVLEKRKEETKRRLELRETIKNGGEDTRIMVKILLNVDLGDLGQAISDKLLEEVSTVDGVGADGDSVYNVDDVVVDVKNTGEVEATFYLERESGKFTSADELRSEIVNSISSIDIDLPITVTE